MNTIQITYKGKEILEKHLDKFVLDGKLHQKQQYHEYKYYLSVEHFALLRSASRSIQFKPSVSHSGLCPNKCGEFLCLIPTTGAVHILIVAPTAVRNL